MKLTRWIRFYVAVMHWIPFSRIRKNYLAIRYRQESAAYYRACEVQRYNEAVELYRKINRREKAALDKAAMEDSRLAQLEFTIAHRKPITEKLLKMTLATYKEAQEEAKTTGNGILFDAKGSPLEVGAGIIWYEDDAQCVSALSWEDKDGSYIRSEKPADSEA